jgi:hypothetical protein
MRFLLAFACFFRLLFGAKLPASAAAYLPEESARQLLAAGSKAEAAEAAETEAEPEEKAGEAPNGKSEAKPEKPAPKRPAGLAEQHREGALAMLALLQREGRLVDFLREDLSGHDDDSIGAAVRDIHRGCKKVLEEHFALEAVMPGEEEDRVDVPRGFDPGEIRLIGEANGQPPFKGVLRHHGWRVTKVSFPVLADGVDRRVLAPAEVEIE